MSKDIHLTRELTLADIEALSFSLLEVRDEPWRLWLPSDLGAYFFKETRLVSLFAQANRAGGFTLIDWIEQSTPERNNERYGGQLIGVAAVAYARDILTATKEPLSIDKQNVISSVIEREGVLEPETARGISVTFCAFDEEAPDMPIAFAACTNKDEFVAELSAYRHRYLEPGIASGYSERVKQMDLNFDARSALTGDEDKLLAGFIYELFLNGFQHGCLSEDNRLIPGFRFVRIKRHIGNRREDLLLRASGFPELDGHLRQVLPPSGTSALYEVSISDQGLGILDRFLATRPEYGMVAGADMDQRVRLVNRIIQEGLTSKRTLSGAGQGLSNAISAVKKLKGFVSLRTNDLWLYNSYAAQDMLPDVPLIPIASRASLPKAVGTTFNMLFPIR